MKRSYLVLAATLCVALAVVGCSDAKNGSLPTDPLASRAPVRAAVPGTCTTLANLTSLAKTVFGTGSPNVSSVLGKLDNLDKQLKLGHVAEAQDQARNIVSFVQAKSATGKLPGTHAQVQAFISGVLCYAGLLKDTYLVYPSDAPQVIIETSGQAGVSLQGNTVDTPTLITVQLLDPAGPAPLITKLDQYPGYVQITASSVLTKPATVAVCPTGPIPADVLARLRLGHQASSGFEITPAADASFLSCSAVASSRMPGWLRQLASFVLPQPLYAATMLSGGGVGGLASEFSPFGTVDPNLGFSGGVGGLASEFNITRGTAPTATGAPSDARASVSAAPGAASPSLAVTCPVVEAPVGTGLTADCRPVVTITTHNGTIMENVPVGWAVQSGGGTIAPQSFATSTCGAYDVTAATTTDVTGRAGVCWNLGPAAGANTVVATPGAGGDAPLGVIFVPRAVTFTATGVLTTPTATAAGASVSYDGTPHTGSGTCSNGLTPVLSYSTDSAPVNAGSYTLTVTCAGSGYVTVTATAAIVITPAAAIATSGSGIIAYGARAPALPCVVSGLFGIDAGVVTCTTSVPATLVPGANVTTPVVSPAAPANYVVTPTNGVLTVQYVQDGCFASPIGATVGVAQAIPKGTYIVASCMLRDAAGATVDPLVGNLVVKDAGPTGTTLGDVVLSQANAFNLTSGGAYQAPIDTGPVAFVSGHYYQVTAMWNDGTTTTGYFRVQ